MGVGANLLCGDKRPLVNLDLILPKDPSPPIFLSLAKIVLVGEVGKTILVVGPLLSTLEVILSLIDGLLPLCTKFDLYSCRHSGDGILLGVSCSGGFIGLFLAGDILAGGFDRPLGHLIDGDVPNLLNTFPCVEGECEDVLVLLTSRKQLLGSLGAISVCIVSLYRCLHQLCQFYVYLLIFRS